MSMSASLYHSFISPSLWKSLSVFFSVLFSFNFSFDSSFLLEPLHFLNLFPISWILFSAISFFSTWERLGELLIHCFISDKQCDHSQFTSLLHFQFLPGKREQESPFYFLPWASMRRIQWYGNSSASGCRCWDFLFIRHLISITSLIPKISYLEGLNHYMPPFYWGKTETPYGHMAYPTLQNKIFMQTYVFAMVYA